MNSARTFGTAGCLLLALGFLAGSARAGQLDFKALDLEGHPFEASSLRGKVVLLDFWAVWCAPCVKAFPQLGRLAHEFDPERFQVLGLALYSGTSKDVAAFLKSHPVEHTVVVGDESLTERFGVIGFPTYILIGPQGKIRERYVGEVKDLEKVVSRRVRKLLGEAHSTAGGKP